MGASHGTGDQGLTVDAYLAEWLEIQRHRLQPTTLKSYTGNVRRYLAPRIGDLTLVDLDIRQLERLYTDLMARGGKDGRPLSRRTVEYRRRDPAIGPERCRADRTARPQSRQPREAAEDRPDLDHGGR